MSRVNFYHLLGLPISPPENDPRVIREAIRRKQTEWSRYRNHPTKGMQAQQYIGLITEINRVMADPLLREKEVKDARQLLLEKARKKLITADRHVGLLLSKGSITAEEITWLATKYRIKKRAVFRRVQANNRGIYAKIGRELESMAKRRKIKKADIAKLAKKLGVDTATIESRIEADLKKKFAEIDRYLNVRTTKEYLTDEELAGLAKLFQIPESEILRRVSCPIRKKSEIGAGKVAPLDKTIENVIEENLKIVGKSSLYDFLGLWLGSSLESLQKRSVEKEAEIRRISQKNVFVTASGILAGHCISVFKTAESRNAYDLSKARSRLRELNPDIEVAGMTGTVRPEYMSVLIRQAVAFGVDPDEASAYIRNYCEKQGWAIEENQKNGRERGRRKLLPIATAAAVILLVGLTAGFFLLRNQWAENRYQELLAQVGRQSELENQRELLVRYQEAHQNNTYAGDVARRIEGLDRRIVKRDFRQAEDRAAALIAQHQFAKAGETYDSYLEQHPDSPFRDSVEAQKEKIPALLETYRFETLSAIPRTAFRERIDAYRDYFARFPHGAHREQVLKQFLDMEAPFHAYIKSQEDVCAQQNEMERCIGLCEEFIGLYGNSPLAEELNGLKRDLLRRVEESREFDALKSRAHFAGNDLAAAMQLYAAYLEQHPEVSTRRKIEMEMAALQVKQKQILLAATHGRFVENRPGVLTDATTGLMWVVDDSWRDLQRCLNYEGALRYVDELTTGGFTDWRIPTPEELVGIYKKPPFFPFAGGQWFWTSTSYRRYSDGWFRIVDVVSSELATTWQKMTRPEQECGAVRAVRTETGPAARPDSPAD